MPNIYVYSGAKAILPWAKGANDIVMMDPLVRIPPNHMVALNDGGRFRKHTPNEMGVPGIRAAGNLGPKRRAEQARKPKAKRSRKQREAARKLVELMKLPTKSRHIQQA